MQAGPQSIRPLALGCPQPGQAVPRVLTAPEAGVRALPEALALKPYVEFGRLRSSCGEP